jgi:hypothetical protein
MVAVQGSPGAIDWEKAWRQEQVRINQLAGQFNAQQQDLAGARALLREAADALVVVVGQVRGGRADASTAAALDTRDRIRAFLAGQDEATAPADLTLTCPRCLRISHNPNDVRERYCGACHEFLPSGPVHLLVNGLAACGAGPPLKWPEGERWTDRPLVATCLSCRGWAREHDYRKEGR